MVVEEEEEEEEEEERKWKRNDRSLKRTRRGKGGEGGRETIMQNNWEKNLSFTSNIDIVTIYQCFSQMVYQQVTQDLSSKRKLLYC